MSDYRKEVENLFSQMSPDDPKAMITDQYQTLRRKPRFENNFADPAFLHKRQKEKPRPISFDQWIFPHINSQWYDINDKTNIAASGTTVVITFNATQDGIFRWFGHMVDNGSDAQLWEYGSWTFYKNSVPVQPWVDIDQMVGLLNDPTLIFIPFVYGDIITLSVTNTDSGAAHDFYSRIKGWTFIY